MPPGPHSAAASEICPLAAQLAHLHRRLSQSAHLRANTGPDPDALAIYVHALATEDVIVQVLLRRTQPLMLEHLPQLRNGASWQTDPETVRHYARVTCTATRTYLAHMDADGQTVPSSAPSRGAVQLAERLLSRELAGPLSTVGIFRVFLIPVLERAARDIADLSGNRSHGRR